jgi:hypothetical protein
MALNIFPHSTDIEGKLTNSTTPSSDNSIANKKYVDDNSGGGGGFTLSTVSADLTLGIFQTAYDAASATGWTISLSGLEIPSGKTLLGVRYEQHNTLGRDSYGSFMRFGGAAVIGIDDPSGSTIMPVIVGGGWSATNSFSQGGPYFSFQAGPSLGWYYQDSGYTAHDIINIGTTATDYHNEYGACCIKVSSATQVKIWVYEASGSYTWEINDSGTIPSSTVLGKVELQYA